MHWGFVFGDTQTDIVMTSHSIFHVKFQVRKWKILCQNSLIFHIYKEKSGCVTNVQHSFSGIRFRKVSSSMSSLISIVFVVTFDRIISLCPSFLFFSCSYYQRRTENSMSHPVETYSVYFLTSESFHQGKYISVSLN